MLLILKRDSCAAALLVASGSRPAAVYDARERITVSPVDSEEHKHAMNAVIASIHYAEKRVFGAHSCWIDTADMLVGLAQQHRSLAFEIVQEAGISVSQLQQVSEASLQLHNLRLSHSKIFDRLARIVLLPLGSRAIEMPVR